MNLQIERQDIDDAINMGQEAPHRQMALEVILKGGTVEVTQNNAPMGQATSIDELAERCINGDMYRISTNSLLVSDAC